ncbi:superoxide dismutase family protein [Tsuneonella sp. SYSU-LHT278]|uniref:superoxide dismutase family protein n=1 Tax=Tsuneonella sediminis TaxID=3416089 RepID=UPI003F7B2959
MSELPSERLGSATLLLASGVPAGTVQVLARGDEVTLVAGATGLAPGLHGFHLHTTGSCQRPDFSSAGGHLNPLGKEHGSLNADGRHLGDLPNLDVKAGGSGSLSAELPGTRAEILGWLFDTDGTAVVVHANADDYRTDPTGNAGGRIACGVLKRG